MKKFIFMIYFFIVTKCGLSLIYRIITRIRTQILLLKMKPSQTKLAQIKFEQLSTYTGLRNKFSSIYNKLKEYDITQFTTPPWKNFLEKIERSFLPYPPFLFLRDPTMMYSISSVYGGKRVSKELAFLESKISKDKLKIFLEEDYVGGSLLSNSTYLTSCMSIHHLYYFIKWQDKTNCDFSQVNNVVEWGGGYGNMAKIFTRLKSKPFTYVIIDVPLISCLQWAYLATIFGEENVNLLQNHKDVIHENKINLMPVCFIDRHKIYADLFISTWGLSESSKYSQDYVVNRQWFNSKHILLGYQKSNKILPHGDRLQKFAIESGATIEDVQFSYNDYYAFR